MSSGSEGGHPARNAFLLALVAVVALVGGFLVRPLVIEEGRAVVERAPEPPTIRGSDARRLVGAWQLVSWQRRDGESQVSWPYGEDAVGQLVYSADGRMSAQLMRRERENGGGYFAYAGSWSLDEGAGLVLHDVTIASDPTWLGTRQQRRYVFEGEDRLVLRVEERGDELVWSRVE